MRPVAVVLFLLAFSAAAAAQSYYIKVVDPVQAQFTEEPHVVPLGVAGPGQSIDLIVDPTSGGPGNWEILRIDPESLPQGWSVRDSLVYESKLKAIIHIGPTTAPGQYTLKAWVEDEGNYHKMGNKTFTLTVDVSLDVFAVSVNPVEQQVGVQQPAIYYITIENKGSAGDSFEVTWSGLPLAWGVPKPRSMFIPHNSAKVVPVEIPTREPSVNKVALNVTSLSSPQLTWSRDVDLRVASSLWQDWKAAGQGGLLFPILEQPIYALLAFIANLIG